MNMPFATVFLVKKLENPEPAEGSIMPLGGNPADLACEIQAVRSWISHTPASCSAEPSRSLSGTCREQPSRRGQLRGLVQ